MAGGKTAPATGRTLEAAVADIGRGLGLKVQAQVKVGRRLWGAARHIDIVFTHPDTRKSLGIECKAQTKKGTAEEKIPVIIDDIDAWPIRGLVVFAGEGFSKHMENYLFSTGKAVALEDLETWLKLYFGLA